MDAQKCWEELVAAYENRQRDRVETLAVSLTTWLDEGGRPPQILGAVTQETEEQFARWMCRLMVGVVQSSSRANPDE